MDPGCTQRSSLAPSVLSGRYIYQTATMWRALLTPGPYLTVPGVLLQY
jgi:hypothetical protein